MKGRVRRELSRREPVLGDETFTFMNRCASRGETGDFIIDEFMRDIRDRQGLQGMLLIFCHLFDFPWRLSSPAVETGRDAGSWDDAHHTVSLLGAAREAE